MTEEDIDSRVADLMIAYGPDGHCDGHERITAFIMELLRDKENEIRKNTSENLLSARAGDNG